MHPNTAVYCFNKHFSTGHTHFHVPFFNLKTKPFWNENKYLKTFSNIHLKHEIIFKMNNELSDCRGFEVDLPMKPFGNRLYFPNTLRTSQINDLCFEMVFHWVQHESFNYKNRKTMSYKLLWDWKIQLNSIKAQWTADFDCFSGETIQIMLQSVPLQHCRKPLLTLVLPKPIMKVVLSMFLSLANLTVLQRLGQSVKPETAKKANPVIPRCTGERVKRDSRLRKDAKGVVCVGLHLLHGHAQKS